MTRQETISVCRAQNCLSGNSWYAYPNHHILSASKAQYALIIQKKILIEVIIRVQDRLQNKASSDVLAWMSWSRVGMTGKSATSGVVFMTHSDCDPTLGLLATLKTVL